MTALPHAVAPALSTGTDYEHLAALFRPIFLRIAEGTVQRERDRSLPYEPITWLKEAGFGAVRVPLEFGGAGASIPQLVRLLIELGTADSNIPQALRSHFGFVEDRLNAHATASQAHWFQRFVAGDLVGGAWTEVGALNLGEVKTRVSNKDGKWVVNGTKYYSTGSLFSDWIDVYAQQDPEGRDVIAVVHTHQHGVQQQDDWDGFGQRTTGSGTSVFADAQVEELIGFETRHKYQTAFYQLVLLAVLAGAGHAALRDFSVEVAKRTRVFSHGNAAITRQDAQVLQVIGKASGQIYAAQASALNAAEAAQQAYLSRLGGDEDAEKQANIQAELQSAQAQIAGVELVLRATSDLFNALGASATSTQRQLDRHWRNARTAASHNPVIYKERIVGDWWVNHTEPSYNWQIGNGSSQG